MLRGGWMISAHPGRIELVCPVGSDSDPLHMHGSLNELISCAVVRGRSSARE